jgi:hypothetical protein
MKKESFLIICLLVIFSGCENHEPLVTKPNRNPVINSLAANPAVVLPLHESNITVGVVEPDGDPLNYSWTCASGSISGVGSSILWTAPAELGKYPISTTVSDGRNGLVSRSVDIEVSTSAAALLENRSPVISSMTVFPNPVIKGSDYGLPNGEYQIVSTFTVVAMDPDGDPLSYTWTFVEIANEVEGHSPELVRSWTVPCCEPVVAHFNVVVTDPYGGSASDTIQITILP